jgi:hypothetical protein
VLKSDLADAELRTMLETEAKRDWNVFVSRLVPKKRVIDHIGRYIRKPPIAQYRLTRISDQEVQYLAKDTKNRCLTPVRYTNEGVSGTMSFPSPLTALTSHCSPPKMAPEKV